MSREYQLKKRVVPAHSPPFPRRGARAIKTLEREGGVVTKRSRGLLDSREAHLILLEVTNQFLRLRPIGLALRARLRRSRSASAAARSRN